MAICCTLSWQRNFDWKVLGLASFLREPSEMMETFVLSSGSIQGVKKYVWKYIVRMICNYLFDYYSYSTWGARVAQCLPPTWRGCHVWVEFVVGCLPCFERFFSGYAVFSSPLKPTLLNSSSIRNQVDKERHCGCADCKSLFISIYSSSYFTRLGGDHQRNVNQR